MIVKFPVEATVAVCRLVTYDGFPAVQYNCPGCGRRHTMPLKNPVSGKPYPGSTWEWNSDVEKPTLSPSILVYHEHPETGKRVTNCHHFVKNGVIEFCSDDPNRPGERVALEPVD